MFAFLARDRRKTTLLPVTFRSLDRLLGTGTKFNHPHRREDVLAYLPNDLETQTRASMEGIRQTLEAAGATFAATRVTAGLQSGMELARFKGIAASGGKS